MSYEVTAGSSRANNRSHAPKAAQQPETNHVQGDVATDKSIGRKASARVTPAKISEVSLCNCPFKVSFTVSSAFLHHNHYVPSLSQSHHVLKSFARCL
jgi:hypothetical protein